MKVDEAKEKRISEAMDIALRKIRKVHDELGPNYVASHINENIVVLSGLCLFVLSNMPELKTTSAALALALSEAFNEDSDGTG